MNILLLQKRSLVLNKMPDSVYQKLKSNTEAAFLLTAWEMFRSSDSHDSRTAGVRLSMISTVEAQGKLKNRSKGWVPNFSAALCSKSSDPLSFCQLLPLGINTWLVWITALLTCIISTLQNIFNYFWKLSCSLCFCCRLLLSDYPYWHWTAFFTFKDKLQDTIHYWLCRDWSRGKAACWVL